MLKPRTELLQAEEHHEKTVWQMTDRQRIEKRLDPDYRHSPLDLTREQLAAIWRNDGDSLYGPMPRAWLTQSHELPWRPLLDVLLKKEHAALELHKAAMADYHHAVQEDASKATLTRKYRETLDTLRDLTALNQQVDQEFDASGLEKPPPPRLPDLPRPPEPKNQAKLDIGTAIVITAPPPRTPSQTKSRSRPPTASSMRML